MSRVHAVIPFEHFQILPELVEECKETKACAGAAKHFAHCEEKVNDGKGFLHEDCVEEL